MLNLQIAKAYLAGTDNGIASRTWQNALDALVATKQGSNQHRWQTAARDKAFVPLLSRIIIETQGELLLKVLQSGKVSTNVYLRRLHNFCADMGWANYHRHVVSKKIYGRTDQYIRAMLVRWARREHRNKTHGWIHRRYFSADDKGSFSVRVHDREGKQRVLKVNRRAHTVIERYIKVRGEANPYDPNHTRYFEKRKCFAWRTYPVGHHRTTIAGEAKADSKRPRKS